jgi:hypothetical protein
MNTRRHVGLSLALTAGLLCPACHPAAATDTAGPESRGGTEQPAGEKLHILPTPVAVDPPGRVDAAIRNVCERDLLMSNAFWTVFHGILGLGPDVTLRDPEDGKKVNALDYIAAGGEKIRGLQFLPTKWGLDVRTGPVMVGQGHQDQFVAEMAQWGMPADRKFEVLGKDYTFMDFVRHTKMRARVNANPPQELSWALVVVSQYFGPDAVWTNGYGEKLRVEDLVRYELDASVDEAPCGGTHRLFGLTWAYHLHLRKGGETTGIWKEVADKTRKFRDLAKQNQNSDGCFSTSFFRGPGNAPDKQLRINTTGHTLEWLALALPDAELKEPWVQDAANALAVTILDLQDSPIEGGSLYHAVHGLLMYQARLQGGKTSGFRKPLIPLPPSWGGDKTK